MDDYAHDLGAYRRASDGVLPVPAQVSRLTPPGR